MQKRLDSADNVSVKSTPFLTFTLFQGWNTIDMGPIVHLMDRVGFIKFRLAVSQNWIDISEAWFTATSARGKDDWSISVFPGSVDFGQIQTGTYPTKDLSISNTGTGVLRINQIESAGPPFQIEDDDCSGNALNGAESCRLSIRFVPENGHSSTGTLSISSNDIDNPLVTVPMSGTTSAGVILTGVVTDESTGLTIPGVNVTIRQSRHIAQTERDYMYIRRCQELPIISPDSITANEYTLSELSAVQTNDNVKSNNFCSMNYYEYYKVRNPINTSDSFRIIWNGTAGSSWTDKLGQSFVPSKTGALTKTSLHLVKRSFNTTGFVKVYLKTMLEGEKETVIAESEPFNFTSMPTYTGMWVDFIFSNPVTVNGGQRYFLELQGDGCYTLCCSLSPPKLDWSNDLMGAYSGGHGYYQERTQWVENTWSFLFKTFLDDQIDQQYDPGYKEMAHSLAFTCSAPVFALGIYNHTIDRWEYKAQYSFWNYQTNKPDLGFDDLTFDKAVTNGAADYYDPEGWLTFTVHKADDPYPYIATDYVNVSFLRTLTAVTDSNGRYTFNSLMPTEYSMEFQKDGYVPIKIDGLFSQEQIYTVNAILKKAPVLALTILTPPSNFVLTTPSIHVQGTVTNNAQVSVNGVPAYLYTDGSYSANIVLAEGPNDITVTAVDDYGQISSQTISVTVNTKGIITGTVSDLFTELPLQSATISVTDSMNATQTATTGADGRYILNGIAAGYFVGTITKDGYPVRNISGTMDANTIRTINAFLATTPPIIDATVTNITASSAYISWTTNIPPGVTSFCIEYGETAVYGRTLCFHRQYMQLNGLQANTMYHFRVTSIYHEYTVSSGDQTFTTLSPPLPLISSIAISNITFNSAQLSWTTDHPTSSVVEYGTSTAYGSSVSDPAFTTTHSIQMQNLASGTIYHFKITAANTYGASTASEDSSLTTLSPISITITSPVNNETINRPDVMVRGTIINSTGKETGVTVNGLVAALYGNQFIANHVPLTEGQNTITVTTADTAGNTKSASTTVTAATTGNYIRLTSNIESGISPLQVLLRVDSSFSITESNISVSGPGPVEFLPGDRVDEYEIRLTTEGIYYFTVSVPGPDSVVYQDTVAITALNKTLLDTLLKAKWEGMKEKLGNRDIDGSLMYFHDGSKEPYRQAFNMMLDDLPQVVSDMQGVELIYVKDDLAKYRIRRVQDIDGTLQTFTYYIYFLRDRKGVWKLNRF